MDNLRDSERGRMMAEQEGPLLGEPADLGWVWVESQTGGTRVLGASAVSPAQAWALALAASDVSTMQELRAVEGRREEGQIELMLATLELCEAWTEHGCQVGWCVYEGAAVTLVEYVLLTANEDRPDLLKPGPRRRTSSLL